MHRRPPGRGRTGQRAVRPRGRDTVARLLAAGLAEFEERGFQAVTVDDIVNRASTSPGPEDLSVMGGNLMDDRHREEVFETSLATSAAAMRQDPSHHLGAA